MLLNYAKNKVVPPIEEVEFLKEQSSVQEITRCLEKLLKILAD